MARKRKSSKPTRHPGQSPHPGRPALEVRLVKRKDNGGWELAHPRCASERSEDLAEVQAMIDGGAGDVARDELVWLLEGCSDFIDAHYLLGVLAVDEEQDLTLARAHFGYAYQIGITAWRRAGSPKPVPYASASNQSFFEAGKGLAYALRELGKTEMAAEVLEELIQLDPACPLGLAEMLAGLNAPVDPKREPTTDLLKPDQKEG